jgi:hypothetical protein
MTQQRRIIRPQGNNASLKIEKVTTKLGMKALNKQQGTHRVIFDTLPLSVSAELGTFRFFKGVTSRQFPFCNISQNKLDTGESMAIERAYLFLLANSNSLQPFDVVEINSLPEVFQFKRLVHSLFNIQIAQKNVTKDIYFGSSRATFNKDAKFMTPIAPNPIMVNDPLLTYSHSVFEFETPFVLPPLLDFEVDVQTPAISALPALYSYRLGIALEGIGGIYDPASNL